MEDHNYFCIEKEEYDRIKEAAMKYHQIVEAAFAAAELYEYSKEPRLTIDNLEMIFKILCPVEWETKLRELVALKEEKEKIVELVALNKKKEAND